MDNLSEKSVAILYIIYTFFKDLSKSISQIEAKQDEIMSEGKAANEKYGIEYTVSQEITCTKEIKQLDAKGNDIDSVMPHLA